MTERVAMTKERQEEVMSRFDIKSHPANDMLLQADRSSFMSRCGSGIRTFITVEANADELEALAWFMRERQAKTEGGAG